MCCGRGIVVMHFSVYGFDMIELAVALCLFCGDGMGGCFYGFAWFMVFRCLVLFM